MEGLRNIWRRKGRSALTIGGVLIGILALTVLGAMAEKMNLLISGSEQFYTSQIMVTPKGSRGPVAGSAFLTEEEMVALQDIPGVSAVNPMITLMINSLDDDHFSLGMPPMIQAMDLAASFNHWSQLELGSGRMLYADERGSVLLGADLAHRFAVVVGDQVTLNGREFLVAGILEKTMATSDSLALVCIEDGRDMLIASMPQLQHLQSVSDSFAGVPSFEELTINLDSIASAALVLWDSDVDAEELSARIGASLEDIQVVSPGRMREFLRQALLIINVVVLGSAGIALVVGGLAVINTMMMAVSERTREIGVKMAVGAKTSQILKEYLWESALIGLIGGILGVTLGSGAVALLNQYTDSLGAQIFQVTTRLVTISIAFAVVLGVVAGFYPALRAARLHCVDALREE